MVDKHPREMTIATPEQTAKYMEAAINFVNTRTGIPEDTMQVMLENMPNKNTAMAVAEFVLYMTVYSVAEHAAQADGLTLRNWSIADRFATTNTQPTIVPGPATCQ